MESSILVTGAGGFLGSYIVKGLREEGVSVIGLYHRNVSNNNRKIQGDLLSSSTLEMLKKLNIHCVVHCAALIPKKFIGEEAEDAARKNLSMDENVIALCERMGMSLIFLSSSSVYGLDFTTIRRENSSTCPEGPYAEAKLLSEKAAIKTLGINKVNILRLSAPYGPGQKADTVLKTFLERAISNENLFYYGTGSRTQDFTFVADVAQGVICCIYKRQGGIFNIAGRNPVSMKELAKIIVRNTPGCKSNILPAGVPDAQENYRANFGISKAERELGWRPKIKLENGIRQWAHFLRAK
jgi:nucleoside-diphosphate-sugar epimerase